MSLLKIQHIGTRDEHRFYSVQTPHGLHGVLDLTGGGLEITMLLVGTYYRREYPAGAELGTDPPRIRDLEGGYQTIAAFVACWEYSTEEQRAALCEFGGKLPNYIRTKNGADVRTKTNVPTTEDRPRVIHGKHADDGWIKVYFADLRDALKSAKGAVRLGHVTLAASIAKAFFDTKGALGADPVLYVRPDENDLLGALEIKSGSGHAHMTIRHGAGDRYKGRAGFTRRLVFAS